MFLTAITASAATSFAVLVTKFELALSGLHLETQDVERVVDRDGPLSLAQVDPLLKSILEAHLELPA